MAVEQHARAREQETQQRNAGRELVDEEGTRGQRGELAAQEDGEQQVVLAQDGEEDVEAAEEGWGEERAAYSDVEGSW